MIYHVMNVLLCCVGWCHCCVSSVASEHQFQKPQQGNDHRAHRAQTTQYAWNYSSHCDPCYYQSKGISHDFVDVWARCHARCFQAVGRPRKCPKDIEPVSFRAILSATFFFLHRRMVLDLSEMYCSKAHPSNVS